MIRTEIPYSTKFSRRIIFAVFANWPQTVNIKLTKCFAVYACIRSIREIYFREMLRMTKSRKLCASKIWRYTVINTALLTVSNWNRNREPRVLEWAYVIQRGFQTEEARQHEAGREENHVPLGIPRVVRSHPLQMQEVLEEELVASAG